MVIALCKKFGKETGFAIGMLLLAPVFVPILGFGSAEYQSKKKKKKRLRIEQRSQGENEPWTLT